MWKRMIFKMLKMNLALRKRLKMKIMKAFLLSLKKEEKVKTRCVLINAINIMSSKELF